MDASMKREPILVRRMKRKSLPMILLHLDSVLNVRAYIRLIPRYDAMFHGHPEM